MTREAVHIDVGVAPYFERLARDVEQTRALHVLERDGEPIALVVPAGGRRRRRKTLTLVDTSGLPPVPHRTVKELAGFAGTLPLPLSWEEMQEVVAEERAAAWRAKHS